MTTPPDMYPAAPQEADGPHRDPRVLEVLRRELPGLEQGVPLAAVTAYGVGGPAELLVRAGTTGVLIHAVLTARELGLPVTVLGRCTNVLVADAGVAGLTVLARNEATTLHGHVLRAEAGVELTSLVADLAGQGLAGLTFAANIPGSVGGAVVGNAGAYGESVSDCLLDVHILEEGKEHVVEPSRLDFGYRSSLLKSRTDIVVLSAAFQLHRGRRHDLLQRIGDDARLRRSKHPLEYANCGSFFKNPSRQLPAARLIEEAGLKGLRVGRAHVSEKHANFLVAEPGATADDITALAAEVVRRVKETSGWELTEEVRRLGFH
ncbi:MAG TPA: UDP-N-acetylmuramate dehydrogenase [Thermoleophilia bacterium]|nr:UDP-N-acetylmuramate dehydrogenase [Acidobacteriota bacterium]HOU27825.1 UDP-N-acetylmuramate dehydrogenase [Thermoleophilia bacterium]